MPRIKVLPHAQICPEGAEFEVEHNANLCESLLKMVSKLNMPVICPVPVRLAMSLYGRGSTALKK